MSDTVTRKELNIKFTVINYIAIKLFNSIVMGDKLSKQQFKTVDNLLSEFYPDNRDINKTLEDSWDMVKHNYYFNIHDVNQLLAYMFPYETSVIIQDRTSKLSSKKRDMVIDIITMDEFDRRLASLLQAGNALDSDTVDYIVDYYVLFYKDIHIDFKINVNEVRYKLMYKKHEVPTDPSELFIYMLYTISGDNTVLVQDNRTITLFTMNAKTCMTIMYNYIENNTNGLAKLSSVFHRYKKLIIAVKTGLDTEDVDGKHFINLLRRKADKYHNPVVEPSYKNVLSERYDQITLLSILEKLDTPYLIKIYRGALYRINALKRDVNISRYKIRNGNSVIDTFSNKLGLDDYMHISETIAGMLRNIMERNIGKYDIVFVNNTDVNINLGIPVNAKQMVGSLPIGTNIDYERDEDIMVGIYWTEKDKGYSDSVDLDLSVVNKERKIGWDSEHSSENEGVKYSGDVTSAPNGASEVIYISKLEYDDSYTITVNNFARNDNVDYVLSLANTKIDDVKFSKGYMMDVDDVFYNAKLSFPVGMYGMVIGNIHNDGLTTRLTINNGGNARNVSEKLTIEEATVSMIEDMSLPTISDIIDYDTYSEYDGDGVVIDLANPDLSNLMLLVE